MTKKSKVRVVLSVVLILALAYGFKIGLSYIYIASSYVSKTVCSSVFISGRTPENVKAEDLYPASFVHFEVDTINKTVTSDVYGLAKTKAIYRKGFGCTLVIDDNEKELRAQIFPEITTKSLDTTDLSCSSVPENIDSSKLYEAINKIFVEKPDVRIRRTRAVVILYDGKIIAEKYGQGITSEMPLLGWSMTKSVTNAMLGILVQDKKLDIYKPTLVAEWQNDERKNITVDNLIRMSSGLEFEENYGKPCDATQMLFREKSCGGYAIRSKLNSSPGLVYYYSSGTTNILQEIIRRQFPNHADYLAFPYNRLFKKIGMESAVIEPDGSGTYVGSSYMYATARDWAKFGQLYLQGGVWRGDRILPEGWTEYSGTETKISEGKYAALFWVNHIDKNFPADAYFARGHEGQFITIIPSLKMVIVRLGCTQGPPFDNTGFVKEIVRSINKPKL